MGDFPTPAWHDLAYWQKRKKNRWRKVEAPSFQTALVDTHCHLFSLSDPAYALARASLLGVEKLCTIVDAVEMERSSNPDTTLASLDSWIIKARELEDALRRGLIAQERVDVGDTVDELEHAKAVEALSAEPVAFDASTTAADVCIGLGCHPHNASGFTDDIEERMREHLRDPRIACIGEIGLDYHYDLSPHPVQQEVFARQIRLAHELKMPIALHIREAHNDAFAILDREGFPEAGVLLHCCSLSAEEIKPWVEAGCYIAYGGPITFNNADYARAGAIEVPLNKLLTETDAPYMTPVPLRGIECLPDHVRFSAVRLAELVSSNFGLSAEEALEAFRANAHAFLDQGPYPCQCS